MLRAKVRKLNKDATGGRRRRAVTGAKISFLKVSGVNGKEKAMEAYIAGAADYKLDQDDEGQVLPTAPIPTAPKERSTKPATAIRKTVPTTTRTRTTTTATVNKFRDYKDRTTTATFTTTTTLLVVCADGEFRDEKTNTCTKCDGPCTTTSVTTVTTTIDRSLEGLENMLLDTITLPPTTDNGDITLKEFEDWLAETVGKPAAKKQIAVLKDAGKETVSIVDATAAGMSEIKFNEIAATSTAGQVKATISTTTIIVMVVIVVILVASVGLVIYCMKKKLDVTASDPNYVRGGGAAFGNPAYAPAGGAVDEANEGYLDIQEAARNAGKKKGTKKKGGLVRQESLC